MNLTDIEAVRQLLDMAQAAGLDLTGVSFGGPAGISVTFARPPAQPVVLPAHTLGRPESTGKINIPERDVRPVYENPALWVGGRPPTFPAPGV